MQRADSSEKTLLLGKIENIREQQRMRWLDGTTDSMEKHESEQTPGDSEGQGSLVWWRTGEPGVMQSMELQRVGHNLLPEQQSNKKETTVGETSQRTSTRCLSFIRNCFVQEILKQIRHRFWSSGAHKRVKNPDIQRNISQMLAGFSWSPEEKGGDASGSLWVSMDSSKYKGRLASSYWVLHQVVSWSQDIAPEPRWPPLCLGCCVTRIIAHFFVSNYSSVFDWLFADWKHLQRYRQSEDRGKSLRSWLFCWWEQT